MAKEAYPSVPLFRYDYSDLSEAQIATALNAAAFAGPVCASTLDRSLDGKSVTIVTDGGPSLTYRFASEDRLILSENGGPDVSAGYGALTLGQVTFFAHLLPNSLRGYAVALDHATGLATAMELWFAGYEKRKREVMRAVWMGYIEDADRPVPEKRHAFSNRIEGKGFYWKQDTGAETLEYFPSIAYTLWVELSRMDKRQGYCAPADYIQFDEAIHLYTRTECEFSGIFTAYVMDLNQAGQIGVRLGFNGADELEFYMFRGEGEWLGQIAKFEEFGDQAGGPMLPRPGPGQSGTVDATAKGARAVYRPMETYTVMTKAEVAAAVKEHTRVFERRVGAGSGASGMAGNAHPPTDSLGGKTATVHYDGGPVMEYRFHSGDELSWRKDGQGDWKRGRYNAWQTVPGVFLFGHVLEGSENHDGHIVVADFESGKATCYNGYLNTPYIANEAGCRTMFGRLVADGVPDPGEERHGFTREMLGRAITYNYSPGLTSMHLYATPKTTSWIIFTPAGAGGLQWAGSGAQVKIRDGLYFLYWIEEACNGTLGTILINMRTMHDAGIGYHCGTDGLSMSQVGALCRHAGQFDVERFFEDIV